MTKEAPHDPAQPNAGTPMSPADGQDSAGARPWCLYLLACRGGSTYVGISPDPERRFQAHLAGKGARYTRIHPPEALLGCVWLSNQSAAATLEYLVKRLPAQAKRPWLLACPVSSPSAPTTVQMTGVPGALRA